MDIVIVAQYLRDIECFDGNNSRFIYIAKMLKLLLQILATLEKRSLIKLIK